MKIIKDTKKEHWHVHYSKSLNISFALNEDKINGSATETVFPRFSHQSRTAV